MKKYIWHMKTSPWEEIMERVEDGPIKSIKKAHEKYLGKNNNLGWKNIFSAFKKRKKDI